MMMRRWNRRGERWGVVLVLAAIVSAIGIIAPGASAQGTDGAVPDPISTAELNRYAERLGLSDQQRVALDALHDEYKRDFRTLREGDIAKMRAAAGSMQGTMPSKEELEKILKDMEGEVLT